MKEKINPIELILDPNNYEDIVLHDNNNKPYLFSQIALVNVDEKKYAILEPIDYPGIEEDEAFAFEIPEDKNSNTIVLVEDDELIDRIFQAYYDSYKETMKNNKKRVP